MHDQEAPTAAVLLVDDQPGALATLADILLAEGFLPRLASSVATARAILDVAPVAVGVFDLVLSDGDGLELARWVWQRQPGLPILFTSAYTDLELIRKVVDSGLLFFPKPLDLPQLLGELRRAASEQTASSLS